MTRPLFFIGDSHSGVYRRAALRAGRDDLLGGPLVSAINLQDRFFDIGPDGGAVFLGRAAENFARFSRANGVRDLRDHRRSLIVSMGLHAPPFYGHAMWRKVYTIAPDDRPERQVVSRAVVERMVADQQAPVLAFYDWLVAQDLIFCVLDTPRPQPRHRAFGTLGAKVFELTRLWEAPVRARLAAFGLTPLTAPGTVDEQGFLREEFWADDWSHANLDYADRLIAEIDALRAGTARAAA